MNEFTRRPMVNPANLVNHTAALVLNNFLFGVFIDVDYLCLLRIYSCTVIHSVHCNYISHLLVL
jgi:hypothetical protein